MKGEFREYNWNDIMRLILEDAGVENKDQQEQLCDMRFRCVAGFNVPSEYRETIVELRVYDKPKMARLEEHLGDVQ